MSARLATGYAGSNCHSVSVSPISQCRPHGITNSTLFSVLVSRPMSMGILLRGTTMWTPFDGLTLRAGAPVPAGWPAGTGDPPVVRDRLGHLDPRGQRRAVRGGRAGQASDHPRVVFLCVIEPHSPHQR